MPWCGKYNCYKEQMICESEISAKEKHKIKPFHENNKEKRRKGRREKKSPLLSRHPVSLLPVNQFQQRGCSISSQNEKFSTSKIGTQRGTKQAFLY